MRVYKDATLDIIANMRSEGQNSRAEYIEAMMNRIEELEAAQQGVQPTYGTLPAPEVWSTPEGTTAPVVRLDPPISG
jgi:hypothetical protein